jgi:hypothetical protein
MDFEKERKRINKLKRPLSLDELAILTGTNPASLDFSMCERCKPYGKCYGFSEMTEKEWQIMSRIVEHEQEALRKPEEFTQCNLAQPDAESSDTPQAPCERCLPHGECLGLRVLSEEQFQVLSALTDEEGMQVFSQRFGLGVCVR